MCDYFISQIKKYSGRENRLLKKAGLGNTLPLFPQCGYGCKTLHTVHSQHNCMLGRIVCRDKINKTQPKKLQP